MGETTENMEVNKYEWLDRVSELNFVVLVDLDTRKLGTNDGTSHKIDSAWKKTHFQSAMH